MTADLVALRDIISFSVDKIVEVCAATGKEFPSLDHPVHPSEFTPDGIRNHLQIADAIVSAVAAAFQLIHTIQPPTVTLANSAFSHTLPFALGVAEKANVAEVLRSAGSKGMHVKEIAAKSTVDPKKLARILRFLATHHWFKEVSPDVFSTNLLSSLLDTGKKSQMICSALTKYDGTSGLAAIVAFNADEATKAVAYSQEVLFDPKTAFSEEPNETGTQRALGTALDMWSYFDSPEGQYRGRRFAVAMSGASKLQPPTAALTAFDWNSLPKDGLIVDVGGGIGNVGMVIVKAYPEFNIVIEDRSTAIEKAKTHWHENLSSHVESGRVHFIECDFFEPQPVLPATPDVFLLRSILHDWSDKLAIKLLRNLRLAAGPNTRLIIIENIMKYACEVPDDPDGSTRAPKPLLPNLGGSNLLVYKADVLMMTGFNSAERTKAGFESVLDASGWKLREVRKNPGSKHWWPSLICDPA